MEKINGRTGGEITAADVPGPIREQILREEIGRLKSVNEELTRINGGLKSRVSELERQLAHPTEKSGDGKKGEQLTDEELAEIKNRWRLA